MKRGTFLALGLTLAVAMNTASGVVSIMAFYHRHDGELALARADLDSALAHFTAARAWQPGDAPTCVLIGRVVQQAQANGLPLEALEGHQQAGIFAFGLAAIAHGIQMNPADAWAWLNLVDSFQGFRSARARLEAMMKAGEAVLAGPAAPAREPAGPSSGLEPEDRVSVAAIFEAIELEPDFYFYRDYLARLYWDRGMKTDAAREIRASLEQWPRVEVHPTLDRGELLKTLAGPVLEGVEASTVNPYVGPVMAMRAKAAILERLGRTKEAIDTYQALREIGDRTMAADCDLNTGKLEIALGRHKESLAPLNRALEEATDKGVAAWSLYYLGLAWSGQGDHARAIEYLRRHMQEVGQSLPGYLSLAEEEELAGRSTEAERLYVAAVLTFPAERVTYLKVIEQMRKHGRAKQALSYAEAYRRIGDNAAEAESLIRELEAEVAAAAP